MNKHSKRNKSKDNPYTLGYDENKKIYIVEFKDSKKFKQRIEINKEIYEAFDKFELEDISQIHKERKHIEHSEVFDYTLYKRAIKKEKRVDEVVEEKLLNETLKDAINKLTDVQKRRIKMYYFEDMTLNQIAQLEKCSIISVKESIDTAIKKLQKNLKI